VPGFAAAKTGSRRTLGSVARAARRRFRISRGWFARRRSGGEQTNRLWEVTPVHKIPWQRPTYTVTSTGFEVTMYLGT